MAETTFAVDVLFFFTPPETPSTQSGSHSVLYLLRREVQDCLIGEVLPSPSEESLIALLSDPVRQKEVHRLFATAQVIFAGVDLLAKFYMGDDEVKNDAIEKRFKAFARECMYQGRSHLEGSAGLLWRVRNAMVHSFSLHVGEGHDPILFTTELPSDEPHIGARQKKHGWEISLPLLYREFVYGIRAYQARLVAGEEPLRTHFEKMYPNYGIIEASW